MNFERKTFMKSFFEVLGVYIVYKTNINAKIAWNISVRFFVGKLFLLKTPNRNVGREMEIIQSNIEPSWLLQEPAIL